MCRITIIFLFSLTFIQAADDFKNINSLTQKVITGDNPSLIELYKLSYSDDTKIRPALVKTVTLFMLKTGSAKTQGYIKSINTKFPKLNLFSFLEMPPLRAECNTCKGLGQMHIICKRCQKGDCRNCKGKGHIVYGKGKSRTERKCIICKGLGFCNACTGTEKIAAACRSCRGAGFAFNNKVVSDECDKALKVLLNKSALMAGMEADKNLLAENETAYMEGLQWLKKFNAKKLEWEEGEKKRLLASIKKRKAKQQAGGSNGGGPFTIVSDETTSETYEEGGSTKTLDHICLEIAQNLKRQEQKSKQSILMNCYGQFLSDVATVHVQVTAEFVRSGYDYKQRAADGFYRFAVLRAQSNGYAEIDFKLLDPSGAQIGGVKDGKFWLKK